MVVNRVLFTETRQGKERRQPIVQGCGVGCKNAWGMQRLHGRQREAFVWPHWGRMAGIEITLISVFYPCCCNWRP